MEKITITEKEGCEERFDKMFPELNASNEGGGYDARIYVKEFIRAELSRNDEEWREKIKGLVPNERYFTHHFGDVSQWNACRAEILSRVDALLSPKEEGV
jgi:hypothetical protein